MADEKTTQVRSLLADCLAGRASRRDVLRAATALGLSAPLMGMLMSAQSVGAQEPDWGSTIVQPANLRTDLAGKKVKAILGASGSGTPFTQAFIAKFTEWSGIEVELTEGPESATDRLTIAYLPGLAAGSPSHDVYMIDVIWPGILAQYAMDLSAAAAENGEYFERIMTNNTVDGKLVGIPWFTDAGLLYFRTDLLEKYGFAAAPATWTELEEMAAAIQEGERAAGNDSFWGFVWQGAAYEGLTCDALEWQVSNGGGSIIEPDGTVSINNENAIAAFERAKGWIGTISPDGVTGYKEEEARGVWQAGNAAFMRNWPYAFSLGQAADSPIKDAFDVTLLPKGDGEGAQNADTLGGWQIMVAEGTAEPEASVEFAKFCTSIEMQKSHAIERSLLPTIAAVYDDEDVLAVNPFFASLKPVFQGGAVPRPSTVSGEYYNDVSTAYFTAVNQILTGEVDAAEAVAALEEELKGIMEEKGM